jgi:hypothetical protein
MTPLLAALTTQDKAVFVVALLIAVAAIAYGWRDVSRFGFRRVRAIAGICFTEAIRRRVLWITPLAIVGVFAVTQLTRPTDEQDAIRQTARYGLFATGLIMVAAAVLLACTNLPKEIESRVIFTIVTKPTTRLEIVLGKVLGFAMVSGVILLIMGAFTFAYLEVRALSMVSGAKQELARLEAEDAAAPAAPAARPAPATGPSAAGAPPSRAAPATGPAADATKAVAEGDAATALNRRIRKQTLRGYVEGGLLGTKAVHWPTDMQVYARDPGLTSAPVRWITGAQQTYAQVPLVLDEAQQEAIKQAVGQDGGHLVYLVVTALVDRQPNVSPEEQRDLDASGAVREGEAVFGPAVPTTGPVVYRPRISVLAKSARTNAPLAAEVFQGKAGGGTGYDPVPDPTWKLGMPRQYRIPLALKPPPGKPYDTNAMSDFVTEGRVNLEISGGTLTYEYGLGAQPVAVVVPAGPVDAPDFSRLLVNIPSSATESVDPPGQQVTESSAPPSPPGVRFLARFGRTGVQLLGRAADYGDGSVAVYRFTDAPAADAVGGRVVLQTKISVDRGGDLDAEKYRTSVASVSVRNLANGYTSPPVELEPQTNRLVDVTVPAEAVAGGSFDVLIRGRTPGQQLALHGLTASVPSVALVTARHSFALNLFKALGVLWLLSVLVVAIAVFCSTFLSWPIAVVLTLLLLLGRWGVDTLGDALAPGSARSVSKDLFKISDAAQNKAVTDSMEALSTVLRTVGPVLPDVSKFPVFEDVDRGVSMPAGKLWRAAREVLVYGVPLVLLTYCVFRRKEVAP